MLKSHEMVRMPGDNGGATCVAAVTHAITELKLLINLRTLIPLAENIPGNNFKPIVVLSVSSSCPKLVQSNSTPAAPAFTLLDSLSTLIRLAVYHSGDRVVRIPLRNLHRERMVNDEGERVIGRDDTSHNWIHFETDSVMFSCQQETPYLRDWLSGRPTRTLIELITQLTPPGNQSNQTTLAQNIEYVLSKSWVSVELKGEAWAQKHGMNGVLGVARGSCEPPLFLDLSYHGGVNKVENRVILVGSAIILSLYTANDNRRLKSHEMVRMPGDNGGATCVAAVTRAIADLKLPINLRTLIPLVENISGCNAMKPGERLILMDGSVVQFYGSEVSGQLVLAETLYYSDNFKPSVVLSIIPSFGTLSKRLDYVKIIFPIRGHSYLECNKYIGLIDQGEEDELPKDW
uniref:Cytosol aminopeptidase domain-containing protein n=1 Tax=Timema poppense TaxID=170557 RepID=A0A7R9DEI6_TIMPO|nr:unnamed protein product [Timema poppensis]